MTVSLSPGIIRSLLSRYVRYVTPSKNPQEYEYCCRFCDYVYQCDKYLSPYKDKAQEEHIKILSDHIDSHGIVPCEVCGQYITPRGKKRHQKGIACTAKARENHIRNKGYEKVNISNIEHFLNELRNRLEENAPWDDADALFLIEQEHQKALWFYTEGLGIHRFKTKRGTTTDWVEELWAKDYVAYFLELANKQLLKSKTELEYPRNIASFVEADNQSKLEYLRNIANFIEADNQSKEAMIAILELATEL